MPADSTRQPARPGAGQRDAGVGGRLTRRTALAGFAATGVALAVAGCTAKQTTSAAKLIAGDALGPVYTETTQLIAQYDRAMAASPTLVALLGPLREEHRQHLVALASLIGLATPPVSVGPDPSGIPLPPPHPTAAGSPAASTHAATASSATAAPGTAAPGTEAAGTASAGATSAASPTGLATPATSPLPSASPSAPSPTAIRAQLSAAEKTAQGHAVAACISVAAGRVPIVAAIAACRATHVAALR